MLSATFIARGVDTLRDPAAATDNTRSTLGALTALPGPARAWVPTNAEAVARANAVVQVAGGLLLAAGRAPRLTAAALAFTMVPGSFGSQIPLKDAEPQSSAEQRRELLTNVSLLGGLIIAAADTAGKPSLAWRGRRAAHQVSASVAAALPGVAAAGGGLTDHRVTDNVMAEKIGHGLAVGAGRGRELADAALVLATELAHVAREHAPEVAEAARERATEYAHAAREHAPELAEVARERGAALVDLARAQLDQGRRR
ncbi:putative membrane protein YphA (DoxX/SURF4 family) [Mycobacterium frederiksbergense]|uniref:Membrane protein YphA (DoxX/SURF4 family) n=1 Tax=Mycolicibacterium frederiksbergense TaxID=117567 RepID=A0ABT6KT87_9MYCO|nr:DoxX family membrane protein [Mycolicibacterium frederiksbergense]MDH6193943.1 putative membrane protein YphA (DoxX/SURF4 family) [Mycolicibacterium frederiksbergense]